MVFKWDRKEITCDKFHGHTEQLPARKLYGKMAWTFRYNKIGFKRNA
jgi:hypothetical protein